MMAPRRFLPEEFRKRKSKKTPKLAARRIEKFSRKEKEDFPKFRGGVMPKLTVEAHS
jgi:hypothetical protein